MKGTNITHNSQDIIFKKMSELFKDETLKYYELNLPKIISVKPTELPVINVSDRNMDFAGLCKKLYFNALETLSKISFAKHFAALC